MMHLRRASQKPAKAAAISQIAALSGDSEVPRSDPRRTAPPPGPPPAEAATASQTAAPQGTARSR
eukprot:456511-Pyramimonas_sp.AAC.1